MKIIAKKVGKGSSVANMSFKVSLEYVQEALWYYRVLWDWCTTQKTKLQRKVDKLSRNYKKVL